jgi:hypothetical protein
MTALPVGRLSFAWNDEPSKQLAKDIYRKLKRVSLLREHKSGKAYALGTLLYLNTANVRIPSADLSENSIGSKNLGVDFRYQPSVAGLLQLPYLTQLNGRDGHRAVLL